VDAPSDHVLESRLLALKSHGRHPYAPLTDVQGNYLQVAGGGVTCMVERFDVSTSTRVRAFHDKPSPVFPDGTVLAFGASELRLKSDEWFHASAIVESLLQVWTQLSNHCAMASGATDVMVTTGTIGQNQTYLGLVHHRPWHSP